MGWADQLQKGAFRGIGFFIDSSDGELGRRVVLHEYPQRDRPYPEDMGRKARQHSLDIFVFGADYMTARDQLIAALEGAGSGTLVHPYRGEMQVVVLAARGPRETTQKGGMARFSVTFVEAGANSQPTAQIDTGAIVRKKAGLAESAIKEDFAKTFTVAKKPGFVVLAGQSLVAKGLVQINSLIDSSTVSGNSMDLIFAGAMLTDVELVHRPQSLADGIIKAMLSLPDLVVNPLGAFSLYEGISDFGVDLPDIPTPTASRLAQKNNQNAFVSLMRSGAVIAQIKAASKATFDSYDQAAGLRSQLLKKIDQLAQTANDRSYYTLADLRSSMVSDITARGANLGRIVKIKPAQALPALVLAQQVYGDARQEADLIKRNEPPRPGMMGGADGLEVLTQWIS